MRFTTILASRIINNAILPLDSEDRANVLIIDDSMFERNRSKKVALSFKTNILNHNYFISKQIVHYFYIPLHKILPLNCYIFNVENRGDLPKYLKYIRIEISLN